ncbi:zinc finger protein 26-like [Microplitis mediator]|uniref:zinc finger protein 26-like n=1 Tax=Microplitis mediator TaxID=375433 RepID=UPI002554B455|nr:zinc finger protein 26-like [Microplitis mediator]
MSQANLNYLSTLLKISLDELKKIEIPEKSVIVTSIRDLSPPTPEEDPPVTREWDEYNYELQSVEYICQDCFRSFSSAEQHQQHVLSNHTDIKFIKTEEHEFETENCDPTVCIKDETAKLLIKNPHDINLHVHHHRHQSEDKKSFSCSTEKELECLFCRKVFASKKNLMLHLETHKKGDNYYCDICLYTTQFLYTFKNHMNQHINAGLLICYECGDSFVYKASVKKHLESHHKSEFRNSNRYRRAKFSKKLTEECPFCKKKFLSKHNLKLHNKTHKKETHFHCNVCLYKTKDTRKFESHSNKHVNDELHLCYHCGRSYKIKTSLEKHLYYQHGTQNQSTDNQEYPKNRVGKKPRDSLQKKLSNAKSLKLVNTKHKKVTYQCDVCLYTTFVRHNFHRHISRHMNNKLYVCYHCGVFCRLKSSLKKHLNFYRDPKSKSINHHQHPRNRINLKLTCLFCQKKFTDVKSLCRHKGTHKKGNNYYCNICLYTTASQALFDRHIMQHHFYDDLFTCYHCGRSFRKKISLEDHLKFRHGLDFPFVKNHDSKSFINKKFMCLCCNEKFKDSKSLSLHKVTHKKGNYFHCNVCLYKITRLENFYAHVKKHFNDKLYTCYHCGGSFRKKISLEDHLKFRHDINFKFVKNHDSKSFITKKFMCLCCKKTFQDFKSLNRHKAAHKKGDNYHCNVCLYKITRLHNFDKHMKKHFDDNLYTCYHCGRSFKKKKILEHHLNSHRDPISQFINHHNAFNFRH